MARGEPSDRWTTLAQFAARWDRQSPDDLLAPHHHELVHHVDDDADMVRHDPHDTAHIRSGVATGEIEETVLFRKARDLCLGVLEDQSVAVDPSAGIGGQRLGAGVENAAI